MCSSMLLWLVISHWHNSVSTVQQHTTLSQTQMTVNGCEEQQAADGQRGTHGTSAHLVCSHSPAIAHSLPCDLCLQWGAAARGLCLQPTLKDKTQHLTQTTAAAHSCCRQKGAARRTLKNNKALKWCQGLETPTPTGMCASSLWIMGCTGRPRTVYSFLQCRKGNSFIADGPKMYYLCLWSLLWTGAIKVYVDFSAWLNRKRHIIPLKGHYKRRFFCL